ncbi:MAG: DUF4153 domain-containing protein [Gemmatimonadota bacterium]
MRFPSLETLADGVARTARRFPLVLLCGAAAAAAGWWMLGSDGGEARQLPERILYVATLGIPAFLGARLLAERHDWTGFRAVLPAAAAAALLAVVYLLRPGWADPIAAARYVQISAGLHLFVAVGPFLRAGDQNGFWQYNRFLLLRFLVGSVFAVVLFGGLAIALAAVDNLLGVTVEEETYGRLWFAVAFVFHPWYFLGGAPDDLPGLDRETDYPAVLKVFGQYILAPIVALYLVILTVYLAKILVTRVWPSGWIGWLVSSVAAAGILSLLILHPVRERKENRWVATYARWFFVALLPSVAMLLMAAWKRIDQYGVTERRYFLVVLALWLAGVSVWCIVRRQPSIKAIPATLCAIAFLTLVGPWGAYAVSERSQTARLRGLLEANGMLADATLRAPAAEVPYEDRREISAVVRYLVETGRTSALEAWLGERYPAAEVADGTEADEAPRRGLAERASAIVGAVGVEYVDARAMLRAEGEFDLFAARGVEGLRVDGYDWIFRERDRLPDTLQVGDRRLEIALDSARATVVVREGAETLIEVPLADGIERALGLRREEPGPATLPAGAARTEAENDRIRIAVVPTSVSGRFEDPDVRDARADDGPGGPRPAPVILSLRADYLVRLTP